MIAVRSIDGTGKAGKDFQKIDRSLKFKKEQDEIQFQVKVLDNDFWEPDKEFLLELYDNRTGYSLKAKDTQCMVTIMDDDNPGILSFEHPKVKISASKDEVLVNVQRKSGCKGAIACQYKTVDPSEDTDINRLAIPGEDYEQLCGVI